MNRTLVSLEKIYVDKDNIRSPVIFIHGFPDSNKIFAKYHTKEERQNDWLKKRNIYGITFTNRHNKTNQNAPNNETDNSIAKELKIKIVINMPPTFYELYTGLHHRHYGACLLDVINSSPTGKVVIVAHDWGATYTWNFLKEYDDVATECIEYFVSLSVGSSFRYDIWEHGFKAFLWLYNVLFCLPYYFYVFSFFKNILYFLLTTFAGYKHETAPNEQDCWHYWFAPFRMLKLPFLWLGFWAEKEFLNFTFPVLFIRSKVDSLASTKKFEKKLTWNVHNCSIFVEDFKSQHFFPEPESKYVISKIRDFHHKLIRFKILEFNSTHIQTQTSPSDDLGIVDPEIEN